LVENKKVGNQVTTLYASVTHEWTLRAFRRTRFHIDIGLIIDHVVDN